MWPWRRSPPSLEKRLGSLTVEDLQVLVRALDDHPEYFQFWLKLRDDRRRALEIVPNIRTQEQVFAYGMQHYGLARETAILNQLIEMPLTAKKELDRFRIAQEAQAKRAEGPEAEPWDIPDKE